MTKLSLGPTVKLSASLCILATLTLAIYQLATTHAASPSNGDCPFCNSAIINKQAIYEGPYCRVLYNFRPFQAGHNLIIPKRHVSRVDELNPAEWAEMHRITQVMSSVFEAEYGTRDFILALQNGSQAGQTVFHSHFHIIPRSSFSARSKVYFWYKALTETLLYGSWRKLEDSEMRAVTSQLSERVELALQELDPPQK